MPTSALPADFRSQTRADVGIRPYEKGAIALYPFFSFFFRRSQKRPPESRAMTRT